MARIEWVRVGLENWARWCADRSNLGSGFARTNPLARLGGVASCSDGSMVPVDALAASRMDAAVASLQGRQSHLHRTLVLHYAKGLPEHQVAAEIGRAISTVYAHLEAADRAIAAWYAEFEAERRLRGVAEYPHLSRTMTKSLAR